MMPGSSAGRRAMPLLRHIILAFALPLQLVNGALQEFSVSAKMNILHYVAKELAASTKDDYQVRAEQPKACTREPELFFPDINFYVLKCMSDLKAVTIHLEGKNVYVDGGQTDRLDVYMPHTEEPQLKTVVSCPEGIWDVQDPRCTTYTLDVYRVSSDIATLDTLGVSASRLMYIKPDFDAGIQSYNTTVEIGLPFSISARAEQTKGRVGIEAPPGSGLEESRNGCAKASTRQTVWDFPGFNAVGQFKFVVCALAPDNIHMTHYELTVIVTPIYSVRLDKLEVKGHKLEPAFNPDVQQYMIHVDAKTKGVQLHMVSEDPEALMTLSDGKTEEAANDNLTSFVKMHDNSNLKVGEPPQWSTEASIMIESADGGTTMTYMVDVKQHVSNYSYLQNLTMGDTACVMDPPVFQKNVTKYYCKFWWEDTREPEVVPIMDSEKCPDCVLLVPSPAEYPKSHLSLNYQDMKRRVWETGKVWKRHFLYGEYHTIPFQVLSADKFTHTTYEVTLERDAPWWMKAAFTRQVSQWATTAALVMAVTTASNFLALTSQIQFMDLTTEIHGKPEVYKEFADHLKAANFDLSDYFPDLGLPSFEDVKELRDKVIKKMQDSFAIGALKHSGTLILQYCYALEASGQLAANGVLHKNKKAALELRTSLETYRGSLFKTTEKEEVLDKTAKEEYQDSPPKSRRLLLEGNTSAHLRGLKQLAGDVSGDAAFFRRLGEDEDDEDDDKKKKDEGPKTGGSVVVVVEWTDHQWQDFVHAAKQDGVTEDDFPKLRAMIPCHHAPIKEVVPFLYLMHQLELIRRMMHTYTGTFIIMVFMIFGVGGAYFWYWASVMRTSQRRLRMLEPGTLSILVLDCGLVGFTKSAMKMLTQRCVVTFFVYKPSRIQIQAFVLCGIILYPVVFVMITGYMIFNYTVGRCKSCEAEEDPDQEELQPDANDQEDPDSPLTNATETTMPEENKVAPHTIMVFNDDVEQWIDPAANEIKVTLEPPIPSWIPVAGDLMTSHVRSCIPVLQPSGAPISFKPDDQDALKPKEVVDKQKLEEEAIKLEKELEAELVSKKHQENQKAKMKKKQEEKELMDMIKKRKEEHKKDLDAAKAELQNKAKEYVENGPDKEGPSGQPSWFPAQAGEDDEFEYKRVEIASLLEEWKSQKGREESEKLDKEEAFAIKAYLEGNIRREKRFTKYNILQVAAHKACLLPQEPFRRMVKEGDKDVVKPHPTKWWFADKKEEEEAMGKTAESAAKSKDGWWLDEYKDDCGYIANSSNQRLVYQGDTSSFFGWMKLGFGTKAGELEWMDEPEDGWDGFDKMLKDEKQNTNGKKYADKWQWIFLDKWDLPWHADEKEENEINCFGLKSVAKDDIPLYRIFERNMMKQYKNRIPSVIPLEEREEIRKWVWQNLLTFTELKLKLGWVKMQNATYFDINTTLDKVVEMDFDDVLLQIEKPSEDSKKTLPGEAKTAHDELLTYCLMKLEDLYEDEEEPWWEESDKPEKKERKVMFDHDIFFKADSDKFKNRQAENQLIPEHGYYSSSCFTRFPNDTFGKKRYVLKKPDDPVESIARVEMKVQLKHVLPLMRYTKNFKVCVPINSLELPLRSNLAIILKESGNGEQFNYIVDRLTTLISIGLLASNPPGKVCAVVFLCIMLVSFFNRLYTNWMTSQAESGGGEEPAPPGPEKEPLINKKEETAPPPAIHRHLSKAMQKRLKKLKAPKGLLDAFLEVDVFVYFLKCVTLFFLCVGQFGGMPPPLCGIACICVCCITMLVMNIGTFRKELNKQIESIAESITEMHRLLRTYKAQMMNWLAGDNPWRIAFIELASNEQGMGMESVKDVHFVVPELGLRLQGKATVDDLLPEDEKLKQQLLKYTAYYNQLREREDEHVISASDLGRYYQDIQPSFTVALDIDQVKLCKAIPPLAATLQCVNHAGSKISQPDFDSYYTLFYPEEWDEETHETDQDFVDGLLSMWKHEVEEWMDKSLGAVKSERTQTKKIQDQIMALLSMPFSQNQPRNLVMIKVEHILFPKHSKFTTCRVKDLSDKKIYLTVLYENEDFMKDLSTERSSGIARTDKKLDKAKLEALMAEGGSLHRFQELMDEEGDEASMWTKAETMEQYFDAFCAHGATFKVAVPATVSKFKIMIWMQHDHDAAQEQYIKANKEKEEYVPPRVSEELIGVSDLFSLQLPDKEIVEQTDVELEVLGRDKADQKRIVFYNSWRVDMHKQLYRIQAADADVQELGCFGRLKKKIWEMFAPPISQDDVSKSKGFVDISIRHPTVEEQEEDVQMMAAVKDVVAGSSEMNKKKLTRHLDRRGILAKFFGMRMDRHCIHGRKAHNELGLEGQKEKLKKFQEENMGWVEGLIESTTQAKREQLLLAQDIRRTLWKSEEMDKAIKSIEKGIENWHAAKEKEAETRACPSYHVLERWRGLVRTPEESTDFDAALLLKLQKFRKDQARASKSILHYVMVADHLKPNKVWRPDAISPHVGGIVVAAAQNVDEITVKLPTGKTQMLFLRQLAKDHASRDSGMPAMVNARLCFEATGSDAKKYYEAMEKPEKLLTWKEKKHKHKKKKNAEAEHTEEELPFKPVYLYWDGFARWVISPHRGEPIPYGLDTDGDKMHIFLFAKDNAITPDRINKPFTIWSEEDREWQEDDSVKCLSKYTGKQNDTVTRAQQLAVNAKSVYADSGGLGIFGEVMKAFRYVFSGTVSTKMSPEIKECLLGLEGGNITVAWKDLHQDELAPFRKFLVDSFGSYYAAWVYMCRNTQISRNVCIKNLAKMLRRCQEELDAAKAIREKAEKEEKGARFGAKKAQAQTRAMSRVMSRTGTKDMKEEAVKKVMTEDEAKKEKKKQEKAASSMKSMFGGFFGGKGKQEKAQATTAAAGVPKIPHDASLATLDLAAESEQIMRDYLRERVQESKVESVAAEIMEYLDKEKDGEIAVQEILAVAELVQQKDSAMPEDMPSQVKEFIKFVRAHPKYKDEEQLWADLSEGHEITKHDFVHGMKVLLLRFNNMMGDLSSMDSAQKAESIFSKLDAQMSNGISLHELIPMSGDRPEDAESNLAKFRLPLKFIKEIRIDAARAGTGGGEDRLTVRFQVLPEFEMSPEWRALKKALQPDWEPIHGFEYIQVAMLPAYLDMWKQVIKDCGMDSAQEWVRFYLGNIQDHPQLDGVYMRQGQGVQRWTDGKTYKGEWDNHVYGGEGALYNTFEETQEENAEAKAIYVGSWQDGKRHGHGKLRWEQDNSDRQRRTFGDRQFSGVTKVYEGNFRFDLFHGQGTMRLEKAVAQSLRALEKSNLSPGKVPFPNLDPLYITSFEGEWASDWSAADAEARKFSPLYENLHPVREGKEPQRDLKLHEVSTTHFKRKDQKFMRYFGLDPLGVQAAGDPMPDLALAFYQIKGGDAKHMKQGLATYADFTIYDGEMKNGLPHGSGKMTQFDHEGGNKGKQIAYYEGEWQDGRFHGKGKYKTADGLFYTGEWEDGKRHGQGVEEIEPELSKKIGYSCYKGAWAYDKFHGAGELMYADVEDSDPKRLLYEGEFKDGMREGIGVVYDKHADGQERRVKLKCRFERDKIAASRKDQWAWACLDGDEDQGRDCKYFFGSLSQDGTLGSWGTLYSGSATKEHVDATFKQAMESGEFFDEISDGKELKYTLYHGAFKDNLPDGFGLQHFQGAREGNKDDGFHGGTYTGEFLKGRRHGRGTWKFLEGDWEFRPINTESNIQNFENDLMHGIGIVEDSQHVHENVIYTKGKCQMPFTELGPPKTGFESAALNDMLPQASRRRAMVTPLPTVWDSSLPQDKDPVWALLKGFGRKLSRSSLEGWEAFDPKSELRFLRATARSLGGGGVAQPSAVTKTLSTASALTLPSTMGATMAEPQGAVALVREPTDLSLPEEDVLIKGGTGENEVINGVYFKLMHTFGVKAFKMVKQVGYYSATPIVRYLYWDIVANAWAISEKPLEGVCSAPGCAFCQQEEVEHPSLVTKPWYIWHGYSGALMAGGVNIVEEEEEEEEKQKAGFTLRGLLGPPAPVDIIKAESIVGFQVQGSIEKLGSIGKGLMLRIPMTLFGRPVYEFEGGGQYLYFLKKEAKIAEGQSASWEEFGAGVEPNPQKLFEMEGYWAIGVDVGDDSESERCLGYCEDLAVTPDQIQRTWYVRGASSFHSNPELKFTPQEWVHEGTQEALSAAEAAELEAKAKKKEEAAAAALESSSGAEAETLEQHPAAGVGT